MKKVRKLDAYLDRFVGNYINTERTKIKTSGTSTRENTCNEPLYFNGIQISNQKLADELNPWWMERFDDFHRISYERSEGDRYFMVPSMKYCFLGLFQCDNRFYPVFEHRTYGYVHNSNITNRPVVEKKTKLKLYNNFLLNCEKYIKSNAKQNGYGYIDIKEEEVVEFKTSFSNVSYNTGYTLKESYNNNYTLTPNVATKRVAHNDVLRSHVTTVITRQYSWFIPKNEQEKNRFSTVIKNQAKIKILILEYTNLGVFKFKRKKEIIQIIQSLVDYTRLVIGKACVDRCKNYWCDDFEIIDKQIEKNKKGIEDIQLIIEEKMSYAPDASWTKKACKQDYKKIEKFKSEINRFENRKSAMNRRIEEFNNLFKELDERLSLFESQNNETSVAK